jgi:predicted ribonuclease YlaK
MKRLSDHKGEEAFDLWVDVLDLVTEMFEDKELLADVKRAQEEESSKAKVVIAKGILKRHKAEAIKILLRIDPTPLDGLNIVTRLMAVIMELGESEEVKSFFASAAQEEMEEKSSGSPTGTTEGAKN